MLTSIVTSNDQRTGSKGKNGRCILQSPWLPGWSIHLQAMPGHTAISCPHPRYSISRRSGRGDESEGVVDESKPGVITIDALTPPGDTFVPGGEAPIDDSRSEQTFRK